MISKCENNGAGSLHLPKRSHKQIPESEKVKEKKCLLRLQRLMFR